MDGNCDADGDKDDRMTMWMIKTTRGMGGCLKNGDCDMIIRWYHVGYDDHDNIV